MPAKEKRATRVKKLTPREERFCQLYQLSLNGAEAARGAGYGTKRANKYASELLTRPLVKARIAELAKTRLERNEITADGVLQQLQAIATADPRELVEHRVGSCRYCHGVSHQYQRTPAERQTAYVEWSRTAEGSAERKQHKHSTITGEFDELGGVGYRRPREPHPACPECSGLGEGYTLVKDQLLASPRALQLLAGVKETRDGFEVKMHDKLDAIVHLGRHLKLFTDVVQHDVTSGLADAVAEARNRAKRR